MVSMNLPHRYTAAVAMRRRMYSPSPFTMVGAKKVMDPSGIMSQLPLLLAMLPNVEMAAHLQVREVMRYHSWVENRRQDLLFRCVGLGVSSASDRNSVVDVLLVVFAQPFGSGWVVWYEPHD